MRANKIVLLKIVFVSFCFWCIWSCTPNTETEIIKAYLKNYNSKNYKALDKILADTVVYVEDDVAEIYTKADFYKRMEWDEVFNAKFSNIEIEEPKSEIEVTATKDSKHISFFHTNPYECKINFEIRDLKISKVDVLRENFDLQSYSMAWVQFLIWVDQNEPSKADLLTQAHNKATAEIVSQCIDKYNAANH